MRAVAQALTPEQREKAARLLRGSGRRHRCRDRPDRSPDRRAAAGDGVGPAAGGGRRAGPDAPSSATTSARPTPASPRSTGPSATPAASCAGRSSRPSARPHAEQRNISRLSSRKGRARARTVDAGLPSNPEASSHVRRSPPRGCGVGSAGGTGGLYTAVVGCVETWRRVASAGRGGPARLRWKFRWVPTNLRIQKRFVRFYAPGSRRRRFGPRPRGCQPGGIAWMASEKVQASSKRR